MNVRDAIWQVLNLCPTERKGNAYIQSLLRVGFGSGIDFGSFVSAKSDSAVIV
jgi:hypothetical protein